MRRRRPGSHTGQKLPAGREARHAGPGRAFRGRARYPVAAALLCGGLLAAGGGLGGLILLTGPTAHHGTSPLLAAHPGRPQAGAVAAPPRPIRPARVAWPGYQSIPAIGVHTPPIRLGP